MSIVSTSAIKTPDYNSPILFYFHDRDVSVFLEIRGKIIKVSWPGTLTF